mgnify:CR=1 FL=1|jgi:hypothetical protein
MKELNDKFAIIWEFTSFERQYPKDQVQIISSSDGYVFVANLDWAFGTRQWYRLYSLAEVQSEQWSIFDTLTDVTHFMDFNFPSKD